MLSVRERAFYKWYFVVHVPITVAIDSSVVVPSQWQLCPGLVRWHIEQNNDFLLQERPGWLQACVLVELVLQLPLFFYFIKRLSKSKSKSKNKTKNRSTVKHKQYSLYWWLRVYGYNASLTTLWCIIVILTHYPDPWSQRLSLMMVYLPTFLIPARLCLA